MEDKDLYVYARRHRECVDALLSAIEEVTTMPKPEAHALTKDERDELTEAIGSLKQEVNKARKKIDRFERTILNLRDVIHTYQDRLADTAANLGERCSQIKHLADENKRLMSEIDAARRQKSSVSVIIPTAGRQPEMPKTSRDMENFGISADPKAVDVIARFTKEAAASPFIERIGRVFGVRELKPEDFHLHEELAIPYVDYGNGSADTFDVAKTLEAWIMTDPKKRIPAHFGYTRGGKVVATKGNSPNFWRLAYQFDADQMLFFLAREYRDVIEAFCSWYNGKVMP